MAKIISTKISVKASAAKPLCKPRPEDKTLGLQTEIRSYELEESDETEEGEEAEIIVIHESILAASKQNLVKGIFPYIYTFDHEGPAVVSAMRDLTSGFSEQIQITSPMEVEKMIAYTQRILAVAALKKYKSVLRECKELAKDLAGEKWTLINLKEIYEEDFWAWDNSDGIEDDKDAYLGFDKCFDFKKELWFELGKCIWRKHRSVFQ